MKDCFGTRFGFFFEEHLNEEEVRNNCYSCEDFDKCYKMAMIQCMKGLRLEIRQGVRSLRNSLGGSHSEFPFG